MLALLTICGLAMWILSTACMQGPEALTAEKARSAILARLSGGRPERLRGVQLAWESYDSSKKSLLTGSFKASLQFPDRLRIEATHLNGASTVWKLKGKSCWVGPGRGPFLEIEGAARARLESTFLLLGSLLGWDLLPAAGTGPEITDSMLVTRASWRGETGTELRRQLGGEPPQVLQLEIGTRRCRLRGELLGGGGRLAKEIELSESRIVLTRFIADCAFKEAFFEPVL
ncbi:MAG: hypothetical protein ACE5F1_22660, partial [Planctomycetota bacterium]